MNERIKSVLKCAAEWVVNIVYVCCILFIAIIFSQVFIISSFKIPSDSMSPGLVTGDNLLVNKLVIGPRIFNLFASLRDEQTPVYRIPGVSPVKRNDVLVFNFPHPKDWSKIEMNILKYYIKRCVAIPGDTLYIKDGFYYVPGITGKLGIEDAQVRLAQRPDSTIDKGVFNTFPYDASMAWNIKHFGPLYIPGKGSRVEMNPVNARLYRKVIEWEQGAHLEIRGDTITLNNNRITDYTFKKNYYFMAGDRVEDSQDSRYWGLLPEEYIVGKAWIIWKSINPATDSFDWNRFLKLIH